MFFMIELPKTLAFHYSNGIWPSDSRSDTTFYKSRNNFVTVTLGEHCGDSLN